MSEISNDILSELIVSALRTDKCSSVEIKRRTQLPWLRIRWVAESLLFVRLFRAAHDLTSWLACLATKPEDQDQYSVAHIFFSVFFFLFEHFNAKLLRILVKWPHQNDRNGHS